MDVDGCRMIGPEFIIAYLLSSELNVMKILEKR